MKLHPLSVPYRVAQQGLAVLAILFFGVLGPTADQGVAGVVGAVAIVVVGLGALVGWQVAHHRRFEYAVTEDTFDIASGVFSRRNREIPFDRIQNVDIAQNPIHRILGIAEVRLETAGGNETEARLRYVSEAEASRLQDTVSEAKREERRASEAEAEATAVGPVHTSETELFRLRDNELWVLGVVSADLRLLGLFSGLLPFVAPVLADRLSPSLSALILLGPLLAIVSVLALWVVSGLYAVLRYYGFRLVSRGEELRYERGLLQRYSGSIPLEKIQTVSVSENVLARYLGYASVRIETAGYAPGQSQGEGVQSAVPIAQRDRAIELARTIEPCEAFVFERPPKRARRRYAGRYGIVILCFVGLLALADAVTGALGWWPLAAVAFVLVPPAAHLKWVNLGYQIGEDHVITRRGFWSRRTTVVPYHRVQTVIRSRTVFQRRRRLGTLVVDTAAGGGIRGRDAAAIDIDADVAATLRDEVGSRFQAAVRADRPAAAGSSA